MFRRRAVAGLAVSVALVLTASGCSSGSPSSSETGGSASSTLTLGVALPATTFVAADMAFGGESQYGQAVYDTLLKADPDGTVVPSLATEWTYDETKTVLDLTLRSDVTFTDGTKFNADAAAQNLKRFQAGNAPNKSFLASMADAKAVDDTHLQVTLTESDPAFLNSLTQAPGYQASPAAFDKPDAQTNPVGSGPYTLDTSSTVIGSSYTFNKNPNYWDKASQHYDKLVLRVLTDPTAMLNAIQGKQINGALLPNNDSLEPVKNSGYTLNQFELNWYGVLLLDRAGTLNPALADVRVRQAINYAFDTEALLQGVGKGFGTLTTQIFPPRSPGYDAALDSKYAYDPAKAKELLAEAGYPNGFTLEMPSNASAGATVFPLIAQQLLDVGITVNFTDAGTNFLSDVTGGKYPATRLQLQQDPTDWQIIQLQIAPTATFNPFRYEDPKVTELISEYHDAENDADSAAAIKELNAYIVDQAWFAPWYRNQLHYATDPNTKVTAQTGNALPYLWNFMPKS
jgi:peptide/nickel transport system substrate-binding protein